MQISRDSLPSRESPEYLLFAVAWDVVVGRAALGVVNAEWGEEEAQGQALGEVLAGVETETRKKWFMLVLTLTKRFK